MSGQLNWHPERLKKAVRAELQANGEIVGKFLEGEARRRLLGLDDLQVDLPDGQTYYGGAAYRKYVAGLIGSEVEQTAGQVEIRVGVRKGRSGTRHGLYIELGTALFAARPFLRPAVYENADRIVKVLAGK